MEPFRLIAHIPAGGGSALASWAPLVALLAVVGAVIAGLAVWGRPVEHPSRLGRAALRVPAALERLTGIPGWAAATAGTSMFGLVLAGIGFYSDVAYHVAYGRDEDLFTAPHVAILIGLVLILCSAFIAVLVATLTRTPTGVRAGRLRVPWSALPLGVIGIGAVLGFPIDELWHRAYGVDVTMWSPPHLMMILGATFTGVASWIVVAESGVTPRDGGWARGFHVVAAWLSLLGLNAPAGEFTFGVPQWQQLFHPVLLMLTAGVALVAMRLVLGRGWALGVAVVAFALDAAGVLMIGGSEIDTRPVGTFVGAAVAVEVVAALLGTQRRLRFAVASGVGIGTLGLTVEWAWNTGALQPWTAALLPEAMLVGLVAAVSAAVLGTAFGTALTRTRPALPAAALVLAAVGVAAALAVALPRQVGDVHAEVRLGRPDADHVLVRVTLDPPDAADDARWFVAASWQGGDRVGARLQPRGEGRFVADRPIEVTGGSKALVRLHRGDELMAVPIRLPADEDIGEPEVPAVDRSMAFVAEQRYLQREVAAHDASGPWLSRGVFALFAVLAVGWVSSLTIACRGLGPRPQHEPVKAATPAWDPATTIGC